VACSWPARLAWGELVDGFRPDRYDLLGAALCPAGVAVIMDAPPGELDPARGRVQLRGGGVRSQQGGGAPTGRRGLQRRPPGGHRPALCARAGRGRQALGRALQASFPDVHIEIVELIAEGDMVVG
jgi:Uncharacterised BCR, YnfA/UPF0060 family